MPNLRLTDITLAQTTAITPSTLIHIVTTADTSQNSAGSSYASTLSQVYDGLSGYCVPDLYVSNLHSCSPLYINPLSEGDIYVGSANTLTVDLTNERIGVGTTSPSAKLHVKGIDSSSSNYGLKIQNSGTTDNLLVRNDGIISGDGIGGNSFQLGSSTPYIEGNLTVGRVERDTNTVFSIYGANYPQLKFDSLYTTKTTLTSGAGGQYLSLSDTSNPKFTWLSSTNIGINFPDTASTISAELEVVGTTKTTNLSATTITASTLNLNGSQVDTAWTSYVPTWTASTSPSIGDGVIQGHYKVIGKTCFVRGNIQMGTTTTYGTGEWLVGLPFPAKNADGVLITVSMLQSTVAWYNGIMNGARAGYTDKTAIQYQNVGGTTDSLSSNTPFVWGNGSRFVWNGSYEIA